MNIYILKKSKTYKILIMDKTTKIDQATYEAIARMIHSDNSPVGIDAKKTHIIIIQKLDEIAKRLERLEQQLGK